MFRACSGSRSTDIRSNFGGLAGRALASRRYPASSRRRRCPPPRDPNDRAGSLLPESSQATTPILRPFASSGVRISNISILPLTPPCSIPPFKSPRSLTAWARALRGPAIRRAVTELLSCGITRGALQIPPDGQPIILQADAQTAGGYPIIAAVIRADIPRLAQLGPNTSLSFQSVSLADAQHAYHALENLTK